jgi:tetratricopeptide (TPR) repeat protein
MAQAAYPMLYGPEQAVWVKRLEAEHDNLLATLTWCQRESSEREAGLQLAVALYLFWQMRGYLSEGLRWLETMLSLSTQAPAPLRAQALSASGFLAIYLGDFVKSRAYWEKSLVLFQDLNDTSRTGMQLKFLSYLAQQERNHSRAIRLAELSLNLQIDAENHWETTNSLFCLADVAYLRGHIDQAAALLNETVAIARELGNLWGLGRILSRQGQVAQAQNKLEDAVALIYEGLASCQDGGDHWGITLALVGLSGVAIEKGKPVQAAQLLGAVDMWRSTISAVLSRVDQLSYESNTSKVQAAFYPPPRSWISIAHLKCS